MSGTERGPIYLRCSKDESLKKGNSPEMMERACREQCDALGIEVTEVIIEAGKGDDWTLPGLARLFEIADRPDVNVVMSFDVSRVSREEYRALWIEDELKNRGTALRYATIHFDASPSGQAQKGMSRVFAQWERATTRMRTGMAIAAKLRRGEVLGNGRTPYGLERVKNQLGKVVTYRATEAGRAVFARLIRDAQVMPLSEVCAGLERDGIRAPGGGRHWSPSSILALLRNRDYRGEYVWGETTQTRVNGKVQKRRQDDPEQITRIAMPSAVLITVEELAAVEAALEARKHVRRGRSDETDDPFALRGRLRCATCRGVLSATKNNGYRRYTCLRAYPTSAARAARPEATRCPLPQVHADEIEAYAWELLAARLSDLGAVRAELERLGDASEAVARHRSAVASLEGQIVKLEARIDALSEDIYDPTAGERTKVQAKQKRAEAEERVAAAMASLAALRASAPTMLTAERIDGVMGLLAEVRTALVVATDAPVVQRGVYGDLEILGTIRCADGEAGAVKLGRDHAYAIEWSGSLRLSGGVQNPQGICILWDSLSPRLHLALTA